jgi:hypothetical protein
LDAPLPGEDPKTVAAIDDGGAGFAAFMNEIGAG